ncbi:MAG: IS200/IS605 family transposase [Saprospiraceae bacterium]
MVMSHSKNKVWIHGVFSTKYRNPLIVKDLRQVIYENVHLQLKKTGCFMEAIGGVEDHVHLLFLLSRSKSLSQVFQQIKGASAFDLNHQKLFVEPFHWQKGYGAFSVSESKVSSVVQYIQNQEEHHKNLGFDAEWWSLLEKHGLPYDNETFE